MPFIGGDGNRGKGGANAPVRNVQRAPAPAPSFGQAVGNAVSHVGQAAAAAPQHVAASAGQPSAHAVQQTFNAQPPHVQAAIIKGAIRQPTNAVAKAVLGLVTGSLKSAFSGGAANGASSTPKIPNQWGGFHGQALGPTKAVGHSGIYTGWGAYRW